MNATDLLAPHTLRPAASRSEPQAVVLIVDNNASKRLALAAALQPLGHRIVEADSGIAALRCVLAEDFAVILLDVQMPEMDGFETASLIRQRRQSEITPIIFITAYSSDEINATDHYAGGAVDFIFAPIPPQELRSKVSFFANVFLNAQRLAIQAAAVQASAEQLRFLTEAAPIGIFQTDADHRYVYTNLRWSEITGVSADEAVGQKWDAIVSDEERQSLEVAVAADAALSHRFVLAGHDRAPRTAVMTSRAIPDGDAGPLGWVGTLADVTVETRAEAALLATRDAALAASNMQRNFAASASHELRTPTASIIGYVEEVLQNNALSEEDRSLLDVVYRNAYRLSDLIDDLMILDETETGAPMMHLSPTPLTPLVGRVIANFAASAQRAEIRLVVTGESDDVTAMVDAARVEQALTNVVSNALKFTPAGGEVAVAIGTADGQAELRVTDTGTGIEAGDLDKIFERFYRTRSAVDDGVKGSGLGLAIVKGMVEAQGGTVGVTSAVGQGSTFTLLLPRALEPRPATG